MKTTSLLIILAVLALAGCQGNRETTTGAPATPSEVRDGVFIHITHCYDDPHRVLMPLKMATMMAEDKDVIVYMDIHAVNLLVKGAEDIKFADFESAHTYIKKLAEMNVGVYACPTCLNIAGFKPEDLMDGVQAAQKDKFFSFTKGRILALDY
ncbi:MAG: peroxiredoxin [Actinomycetota bacterium]|jgi:predicted peroxiredoxin